MHQEWPCSEDRANKFRHTNKNVSSLRDLDMCSEPTAPLKQLATICRPFGTLRVQYCLPAWLKGRLHLVDAARFFERINAIVNSTKSEALNGRIQDGWQVREFLSEKFRRFVRRCSRTKKRRQGIRRYPCRPWQKCLLLEVYKGLVIRAGEFHDVPSRLQLEIELRLPGIH